LWCAEAKSQNGDGVMLSELAMAVVPTSESYINPSHLGLAVRNGEVPQLTTIERAGLTLLFLEPYRLTILQDPFTKSFYQHPAESAGHRREMKLGHGRMKRPYERGTHGPICLKMPLLAMTSLAAKTTVSSKASSCWYIESARCMCMGLRHIWRKAVHSTTLNRFCTSGGGPN